MINLLHKSEIGVCAGRASLAIIGKWLVNPAYYIDAF